MKPGRPIHGGYAEPKAEPNARWWSPPDSFGANWLTNGAALHPLTVNLVVRFARALAAKLAAAEVKYGYSDGWRSADWIDECRAKLLEHIAKGDPRDVAAYCAFLWHHSARTTADAEQAAMAEAVKDWTYHPGVSEQAAPKAKPLRDLLEEAHNGLKWYRDAHPEDNSGADDELYARIEAALAVPSGARQAE